MPLPIHQKDELAKMDDIANRNTDAALLRYVYEQVKDKLLANPSPEALSRVKGCSVMAKLDMIKEAERMDAARRFGEFRQLPLKGTRGLDYTKSVREVSPRNALETIIRQFTDSAEQKREQKELSDVLRQQLTRSGDRYIKATDVLRSLHPDDIPMLDKDSVLNVQNICGNPIHRSTEAAKSPVNNHEVTLGDNRSLFVP